MSQSVAANRDLPYGGPGTKLTIPTEIWERSLAVLREYSHQRSEGLVFLGGVVNAAGAYVTGLYVPRHAPQGARARLTPEQSRWLLRSLRHRDEKLLAQMHSHPGEAYHSPGDDERATSFHPGFISIVAPDFGMEVDSIEQCAIFEFDGRTFGQLDDRAARARVRLASLIEDREPGRSREPQRSWFYTIASKLKQKLTGWRRR